MGINVNKYIPSQYIHYDHPWVFFDLVYSFNLGLPNRVEHLCMILAMKKPDITPPKFNMEPENDSFQEELPFLGTSFQVPC